MVFFRRGASSLASLLLIIAAILATAPHVDAITGIISVNPSPIWRGVSGNWSSFEVHVGSPPQPVLLTVSTTSLGLRVPNSPDGGENVQAHGFARENSTSWHSPHVIDSPNHTTIVGVDTVRLSLTNSTVISEDDVMVEVMQISSDMGCIGLGTSDQVQETDKTPPLINQLLSSGRDNMTSGSYGYTAGASYEGIPASLTFGGYDSARVRDNPKTFFKLRDSDHVPVVKVWTTGLSYPLNDEDHITAPRLNPILQPPQEAFLAVIDPATPYLWFPKAVCDSFATIFNLTWNDTLQFYQFPSRLAARQYRDDQSLSFVFGLSDYTGIEGARISIYLSRLAFALTMKVPISGSGNKTDSSIGYEEVPYFPLKPRDPRDGEFIIGRAFLQETYLFTDYSHGMFFIDQAIFPQHPLPTIKHATLRTTQQSETEQSSTANNPEPHIREVGIGIGVGVSLLLVSIWGVFHIKKRRQARKRLKKLRIVTSSTGNNIDPSRDPEMAECRRPNMGNTAPDEDFDYDLVRDVGGFVTWAGRGRRVRFALGDFDAQLAEARTGLSDFHSLSTSIGGNENDMGMPTFTETDQSLGRPYPPVTLSITEPETPIQENESPMEQEISEADSMSSKSLSASDSSVLAPLEIYKQRAVNTLMTEFKSLLGHGPYIGLSVRAGGRQPSSAGLTQESSTRSSVETGAGSGKRPSAETPEGFKKPRVDSSAGPRFACPYYKRNPKKHLRHRACAGPGWSEVRRVKEHLYRSHALPIHCNRCGMTMNTEVELRAHQRQPVGCEVRLVDLPEGFDKAQEMELRKKKHGEAEEERWYAMYKILFPDEDGDLVPSPYYQYDATDAEGRGLDELKQYERFQRREMLRVARRLFEEAVSGMAGPLEDQLRTQFVGIVRQAQTEVFQAYRGGGNTTRRFPELDGRDSTLKATNRDYYHEGQTQPAQKTIQYPQMPISSANLSMAAIYQTTSAFDSNSRPHTMDYEKLFIDEALLQSVQGASPDLRFDPGIFHKSQPSGEPGSITHYRDNTSASFLPSSGPQAICATGPSDHTAGGSSEGTVFDSEPFSQGPSFSSGSAESAPHISGQGGEVPNQSDWDRMFV